MSRRTSSWMVACALVAGLAGADCATTGGAGAAASASDPDARAESAAADQIRARLTSLRVRRGLGPAEPFQAAQSHLTNVKGYIADGVQPEAAFHYALQSGADEGMLDIRSWCLRAERLEDLKFPTDLARPAPLNVAIAVVRQPEGKRPRYLVLLAVPSPSRDQRNWQ